MIFTNLLSNSSYHKMVAGNGKFAVIEYDKDLSVSPSEAEVAYFASEMNVN